mgnify:FL=1
MINTVPHGTLNKINEFVDIVFKFNNAYRLVGSLNKEEFKKFHVEPILLMDKLIDSNKIYDIGSGNGVPGIIVYIIKNVEMTLVEIDRNKAYILREISKMLDLGINVENSDYSKVAYDKNSIVLSKGLLNVEDCVKLMEKEISIKKAILVKGKKALEEKNSLENQNFTVNIIKTALYETNFVEINRNDS